MCAIMMFPLGLFRLCSLAASRIGRVIIWVEQEKGKALVTSWIAACAWLLLLLLLCTLNLPVHLLQCYDGRVYNPYGDDCAIHERQ